jgi:uncharacterized membrane protein YdjX (TVP38/TMEM64 family)
MIRKKSSGAESRLRRWSIPILGLLLVTAVFVAGRMIDMRHYTDALQLTVRSMGPWGGFGYILIYVAAMILLLPGTPFTIAAAFLFGSFWGYLVMLAASTLAAIVGFTAGRYFARDLVERKLSNTESFQKMKGLVEENHRTAIAFIHVMPVFPFSITNYAFGLTRISFWSFILYSELVFIPMNALLVLGARAIYSAAVQGEVSWSILLTTLAAGVCILVLGYFGKKTLGSSESAPAADS